MFKYDKDFIKSSLTITDLLCYYGAVQSNGDSFYCFRHDDNHPSLIANDKRGVCTCMSPECDLRGDDIFSLIQKQENIGSFQETLERAYKISLEPILHDYKKARSKPKKKPSNNSDIVPKLHPIQPYHLDWLDNRVPSGSNYLVKTFMLRSAYRHIAIPLDQNRTKYVFVPLNKLHKTNNPNGDQIFYRGKNLVPNVFPDLPREHYQAKNVIVVEGEKDVMATHYILFLKGMLSDWAVITNTMGAGNMKEDTPLFKNFDPHKVKQVLICYDHDKAGIEASKRAKANALKHFTKNTQIIVNQWDDIKPKGYDMGDAVKKWLVDWKIANTHPTL